jgi:hypothetical protein
MYLSSKPKWSKLGYLEGINNFFKKWLIIYYELIIIN